MSAVDVFLPLTAPAGGAHYREVIGHFASGVTIVTTNANGKDFGTTVSAVSSVSADPPTLLACLNMTSQTGQAVGEAGRFVVNVLTTEQADTARRFAVKGLEKFAGIRVSRSSGEMPYLTDALACLECEVTGHATAGTHRIFIAEVVAVGVKEGGRPLTYYRGKFGGFHQWPVPGPADPYRSFLHDTNMDLW